MSQTSDESGFNSVFIRLWHTHDSAGQELESQRGEDTMLRATRDTFQRRRGRRGRGRMMETQSSATSSLWRIKLFLLPNADQVFLPPHGERNELTRIGLGTPSHDLPGVVSSRNYVQLSWSLLEFNNYICQSFPNVALNVIGFHLARANQSRLLTKIQANTLQELKTAFGRSRVYIIPGTSITLPSEISGPEGTLPEISPPAGPSQPLLASSSSSTSLMTTCTVSPTASGPAASPSHPPTIYVGPTQSPTPSALRPSALADITEVTPQAPTVPMNMLLVTSNSNSHESSQSLPHNTISISSTMDADGSSPGRSMDLSLVFYGRSHVEPGNRTRVSDFLTEDAEDGEGDKSMASPFESDHPPSEEVDLAVILRTFQEDHLSDDLVSTICIRRRNLLQSAMKAVSRVTFCWTRSPHIEFVGEDTDGTWGPRREFFRLLMIEVQTSLGIFEGKADQVFFSYDQGALEKRKYFSGGNLVAWSIAHGGPGIKALDPSLFRLMCSQEPPLGQFDWQVLPDPDVQAKVKRILQCKTAGDLTTLQQDLGDWIAECGVPGIFSAIVEDIPKIYAYVVKHYIFLRTAGMIHQFTDGINAFGKLWDLVKNNWTAFLPLFTNMQEPLSKAAFKNIFRYNYSSRGTIHREAEEDTIYSWEMVLNMIEDKVTELRFEDLLIFITGADDVPAVGFPRKPCIDFYEQQTGQRRLPYASTRTMCLYLPRGVSREDELYQMLSQAIGDSLGFV